MKKFKTFFKTPGERKKHRQTVFKIAGCSLVFVIILFVSFSFYRKRANTLSINNVHALWTQADYQGAHQLAETLLAANPFNYAAQAYRGFSAFYLCVSEPDVSRAQAFLDDAIISMRKALLKPDRRIVPQLNYMLGKAYFYKNTISAYHYYADLAVVYLEKAKKLGFAAIDIPELLGLSYAALGMTDDSIMAFSDALLSRDSDILELAIAEQYYKNVLYAQAKPYLDKVKRGSSDDVLVLQSQVLLGNIYLNEGMFEDARKEFEEILKKDPFAPDAHYGMGLLFEKQNDFARARAKWRETLKYDVNHIEAKEKLGER